MKSLSIIAIFIALPWIASGQWILDKGHSKFTFIVGHHGISEVDGYFKKFEGKLNYTKDDLSDAVFEVNVETASINTDLEPRDNHLRSEDIFDVTKFPTMTFKSTSIQKKIGNQYTLQGDLTIKGITKSVAFDLTVNGPVPNPNPNAKAMQMGVKATARIRRLDFNLGSKLPTMFVTDEIEIRATGELNKTL